MNGLPLWLTVVVFVGAAGLVWVAGLLLAVVYILGLLFRPRRRVLGIGIDFLLVLLLYAVAGLFTIATAPSG